MWLAPPLRGRGTTGPIRTQPLYHRSNLRIRRHRIGSCKVFFVLDHRFPILECAPRDPLLGGSSYRKPAVPNCNGPSAQWIFSAIVQLAYSVGVKSSSFTSRKVPKN